MPALFDLANLALVAIVVGVIYVALERLGRSPWGRVLRAIREDERAAMALGKNPTRYRLQAFALGGALMGLAGAIGAHFIGFIAPENYTSSLTFQVWAMLIVGGSGNNLGAIIGAGLVWALWSASGLDHRRSRSGVVRGPRRGAAHYRDRRAARDYDRRSPARPHRRKGDGFTSSR